MEKKFRTLSACLRRGRLSILFALLFALQTGYGTPAAALDAAAGISGQTCSATASGKVTDETGTPDRKSTRLNSSHDRQSRMPSSA